MSDWLKGQVEQALKQLNKSVCILVSTSERHDHSSVVTAICNVSNNPPSLLVCVEKKASFSCYQQIPVLR
jgi:flavin reductase (DIM6/NTAB) family NADH-FMN oxidoreductase RutF